MTPVALGFRVKSGYAIAVALRGPAAAPSVLLRRIVELSDPAKPQTRQPYHDGWQSWEPEARELTRRIKIVARCAARSLDLLLNDAILAGLRCRGAGLVVGSLIDPARVGNLHIRAHANEGQLFRTALADALSARRIACDVTVEKALAQKAVEKIGRPDAQIKKTIAAFGKAIGGSWRAEEKTACAAAWMALS